MVLELQQAIVVDLVIGVDHRLRFVTRIVRVVPVGKCLECPPITAGVVDVFGRLGILRPGCGYEQIGNTFAMRECSCLCRNTTDSATRMLEIDRQTAVLTGFETIDHPLRE